MISYKAPGKIILSGEHSVVYAKPAFVTALDYNLTFQISENKNKKIQTDDPSVKFCESVVKLYLKKNKIKFYDRAYQYTINSDIPIGRGMGSSAAFCVAAVASFLHFYSKKPFEKSVINTLAYECEKFFHGRPSGVDVSASCFGGLIYYRKEFEFLKTISALNFKISKNFQERLVLIDTGRPDESTADMIEIVGKCFKSNPFEYEKTLSEIEKLTKRLVISVVKEDADLFAHTIFDNQRLLIKLGIVSKKTQKLIEQLSPYGVAKITGAGGLKASSGMILCFVKDMDSKVKLSKILGQTIMPFRQNYSGVVEC